MNINELFEKLQDEYLPEELNGEFVLAGNLIVWTYDLDEDSEGISIDDEDDEDNNFSFEASSPEELLLEAYREDLELLETFLDEIEETENWTISDSETIDNIITFKIF
jgi:hypothetical protein